MLYIWLFKLELRILVKWYWNDITNLETKEVEKWLETLLKRTTTILKFCIDSQRPQHIVWFSLNTWNIIRIQQSSETVWTRQFLASRDECPGSLCHSPTVCVRVCEWPKTLTLAITFLPEEMRLSYCICVLLVTRPFTWDQIFWPHDLDLEVWPTFEKL